MPGDFVSVDMADLGPIEAYGLLASLIVPRPIAFVTTVDEHGNPNLAPFSFVTIGGSNPPSLVFSATLSKAGQRKDTLKNVTLNREFVVNCVHREMAESMNRFGSGPREEGSDWEICGFDAIPSLHVRPPRIQQSRVQMECRVFDIVEHGDGPDAARYVIGEVLALHRDPAVTHDFSALRPIARLWDAEYFDFDTQQPFRLAGP